MAENLGFVFKQNRDGCGLNASVCVLHECRPFYSYLETLKESTQEHDHIKAFKSTSIRVLNENPASTWLICPILQQNKRLTCVLNNHCKSQPKTTKHRHIAKRLNEKLHEVINFDPPQTSSTEQDIKGKTDKRKTQDPIINFNTITVVNDYMLSR